MSEELDTLPECPACDGTGRLPTCELPCGEDCCGWETETCPECKGLGVMETNDD